MKLAIASFTVASVAAFAPAGSKKAVTKLSASVGSTGTPGSLTNLSPKPLSEQAKEFGQATAAAKASGTPSTALPWSTTVLDGDYLGDVGFDPFGLSVSAQGRYGVSGLDWYREAELMHGRICQIAVLGFIWPSVFGTFPGNSFYGQDCFNYPNPLEAFGNVHRESIVQIHLFMSALEMRRVNIIREEGSNYVPGDQRFGQTGWNPFGLDYTPEEFEEKRLQELKHCRLAMLGFIGLWSQAKASGVGIGEQLGAAFHVPDYVGKAGYYFPEGI
jgi:hypothetical protein